MSAWILRHLSTMSAACCEVFGIEEQDDLVNFREIICTMCRTGGYATHLGRATR